jgi:hypothetical protein
MIRYLLFIMLPLVGKGQVSDTTCIQTRWIALKANDANKVLFDSTKTIELISTIKQLVISQELSLYKMNDSRGLLKWNWINYNYELQNNLADTTVESKDPYFEYLYQSDTPLYDENGDPIIILHPDGTETYIYPHLQRTSYTSFDCEEIRIKEERTLNSKTNTYYFKPTGIGFYLGNDKIYGGEEMFWVDLNELFKILKDKEEYPWYDIIVNQKYQGFQYMQTPCQ